MNSILIKMTILAGLDCPVLRPAQLFCTEYHCPRSRLYKSFSEFSKTKMGNSNSLPDIPGGGTDGYHVLRVQVHCWLMNLTITLKFKENSPGSKAGLEPFFDFIVMIGNTRLDRDDERLKVRRMCSFSIKTSLLGHFEIECREADKIDRLLVENYATSRGITHPVGCLGRTRSPRSFNSIL